MSLSALIFFAGFYYSAMPWLFSVSLFFLFFCFSFLMFFFFKQKTAYEISACLVGSEMCIRDRHIPYLNASRRAPAAGTGGAVLRSVLIPLRSWRWSGQHRNHSLPCGKSWNPDRKSLRSSCSWNHFRRGTFSLHDPQYPRPQSLRAALQRPCPVSYTHLTLPTNREVLISVVAVSIKKIKKKTNKKQNNNLITVHQHRT